MTSRMKTTPLRRADIPELSRFLISGFGLPATSSIFSHEVLSWKYFDGPGGPTEDSVCSLVARSAGKIIGHIGICHRQLIVSGDSAAPVSTMHAIDWLGSPAHPGSGAVVMLEALATSQTQFAVGGTEQAQALFPRFGFEQKPTVAIFRKVLAPFHRLRATDQGFFRRWAGTAKDIVSVRPSRKPPVPQIIELRAAPTFADDIDCLQRQSPRRIVTCLRDHLLLNYLLRYPLSGFSGWTIHTAQRMIGAAVLKITPRGPVQVGSIVDCWLDTEDPSCWQAAVAAIVDRFRALAADDVRCYATNPNLQAALLSSSFVKSGIRNVYVRDKQQLLPRDLPFGLSEFDADGAIL
jgi:hypothetical protein